MSFKFSTNFLLPYVRKPAKYGGLGSIGLDATPTVLIHIGHPVVTATTSYQRSLRTPPNESEIATVGIGTQELMV